MRREGEGETSQVKSTYREPLLFLREQGFKLNFLYFRNNNKE
jgi:hypothetical protein